MQGGTEFKAKRSEQQLCSIKCLHDRKRTARGIATCRTCKRQYEYRKRSDGRGETFCSIKCLGKSRIKHKDAKTHRGWYGGRYLSVEARTVSRVFGCLSRSFTDSSVLSGLCNHAHRIACFLGLSGHIIAQTDTVSVWPGNDCHVRWKPTAFTVEIGHHHAARSPN